MLFQNTKGKYEDIGFDFGSLMAYQGLIKSLDEDPSFQEQELGEAKSLIWDYDFLITVMTTIAEKQSHQLEKIDGFSYFWMTYDYIYETATYALSNNKQQVGQREFLNTFKYWNYLPFKIRLDILDDLFEIENISYDNHPFQLTSPQKEKKFQKIIPFHVVKQKTE